jgi:hypothetical protein
MMPRPAKATRRRLFMAVTLSPDHRCGLAAPRWCRSAALTRDEERDRHPDRADPPPWATEILVEARSGGTCVVRLASGLYSNAAG